VIHPWHDLPAGTHPPDEITAIIEIPGGSRNKYELDKATGLFRLDRVLYSAVHYPGDYGFVPRTLSQDGDPCDVLVLIREPTFVGCEISVRPIGLLRMLDRGEPDEKIVAVPARDPFQNEFFDIADLPQHSLKEIEHFFEIYKDLEGKRVQVVGWEKSDVAMREIAEAIRRYEAEYGARRRDPARAAAAPHRG
jgi:inorganic pyrophosphatase